MASTRGRQVVIPLTNKSGGSVAAGDVVVIDTTTDDSFTTTTVSRTELSVGIAQDTIAANAAGRVLVSGYAALINVPASVTRGHYIETHTVVKQATGNSARRSGSFGQFGKTSATPSGWIWGSADQTSSSASGEFATGNAKVATQQTTASTSFADLATSGPSVTVTIGASGKAELEVSLRATNSGVNDCYAGVDISGATTTAAATLWLYHPAAASALGEFTRSTIITGLAAGSTTFKMQYAVAAGTGTFNQRELSVKPVL